jgi:alpha/beta superfamily hydrolase
VKRTHQLLNGGNYKRFSSCILGIVCILCLETTEQNEFNIGVRFIKLLDSTRVYKPNTIPSDDLHYRPLEVDVWYPAVVRETDTTASFLNLVELLEARAKLYNDTKDYSGISDELLQYICAGSNCSDYSSLKKVKTESYVNAPQAIGSFPLILYFSSMNGMSYENYLLFESLTKKGYVVASITSVGRYPGDMTMQLKDLQEQIADAKFIKDYLMMHRISSGKTALIGYSWGGLAATLLAMEDPSAFRAVISLNGSEAFHYNGNNEDEELQLIRNSESFAPANIRAPYLYLDSDINIEETEPDSLYNIHKVLTVENTYLKVKNATHEDFSCIYALTNDERKILHGRIQSLVIGYLSDKLQDENGFHSSISSADVSSQFPTPKKISGSGEILIQGTVRDDKTNFPLPYVNVGVVNNNKGTATDANGQFRLKVSGENHDDTLKISMVGYEPNQMRLKDLFVSTPEPLNIRLRERTSELKEVVVTARTQATRILGNKSQSKFFGGKFASTDLGSEMGIKINIGKHPVFLNKFTFNVSYNEGDSAAFRFNLYNVKNGLPHENILQDNIIVRIGNKTGKIEIDLTSYNIFLHDDFIVSLEFIEGSKNSGIVFSAGFVNKGTYYRKASQGRWKRYPMGVGFNVTVGY